MTIDLFLALLVFAFVSSMTPGPNNMLLMSSGLTFGFRRTLPHMAGVAAGHSLMILAIGFGLGEIFTRVPATYTVLKVLGAAYMLYLAWKIAHAGPIEAREGRSKPFTFLQAALFQWINPKGIVMAVTVVSIYTAPEAYTSSLLIAAGAFFLTNCCSVTTWTLFGTVLRRFLSDPVWVRRFNVVMAILLVLSLIPMLWT